MYCIASLRHFASLYPLRRRVKQVSTEGNKSSAVDGCVNNHRSENCFVESFLCNTDQNLWEYYFVCSWAHKSTEILPLCIYLGVNAVLHSRWHRIKPHHRTKDAIWTIWKEKCTKKSIARGQHFYCRFHCGLAFWEAPWSRSPASMPPRDKSLSLIGHCYFISESSLLRFS